MTDTVQAPSSSAPAVAASGPVRGSLAPGTGGFLTIRGAFASLVAALAVALVAHAVNVVGLFLQAGSQGAQPATLLSVSNYFALTSVFAFLFLFIGGLIGGLTRWYWALLTGIVAGVLAAVLGSVVVVTSSGNALSGGMWVQILNTIGGLNFIFELAVVVAAVTLGRVIYRAVARYRGGAIPSGARVALVRIPASNLAAASGDAAVDPETADTQWDAYVAALAAAGWQTVEVPVADDMPRSVFAGDTAVVLDDTAVIAMSGTESRRGETEAVEERIAELGLDVARIELPGTLDGADVLVVGRAVYVGRSADTNGEGIRQLRTITDPLGFTVVAVPLPEGRHLGEAVSALPDGTVVGYAPDVPDSGLFDRFLPVPEPSGAHVVALAADTVLLAASAPESAALIRDLGYRVVTVDIGEFEKIGGRVTQLSARVS